ncbi:hypothetical protein Clacol_004513 [Clathrus columnatus]|uniref:NADAR domain-containing protein n=1 Tax=Clathrus columnatus TaxID=1419009 RepID=A0AAV5A9N8_9AGAM|nr:hypothetical protein Clacol_004513 [Clathrus columnatus]
MNKQLACLSHVPKIDEKRQSANNRTTGLGKTSTMQNNTTCQYPGCTLPVFTARPRTLRHKLDLIPALIPVNILVVRGKFTLEVHIARGPIEMLLNIKEQFEDDTLIETIRTQPTPRAAFETARQHKTSIRQGWYDKQLNIKMMEKTILLKFTQHEDLTNLLVGTGDALLKEKNSPTDRFWGIGSDGQGENRLGLVLMKVRELLKTFEK